MTCYQCKGEGRIENMHWVPSPCGGTHVLVCTGCRNTLQECKEGQGRESEDRSFTAVLSVDRDGTLKLWESGVDISWDESGIWANYGGEKPLAFGDEVEDNYELGVDPCTLSKGFRETCWVTTAVKKRNIWQEKRQHQMKISSLMDDLKDDIGVVLKKVYGDTSESLARAWTVTECDMEQTLGDIRDELRKLEEIYHEED